MHDRMKMAAQNQLRAEEMPYIKVGGLATLSQVSFAERASPERQTEKPKLRASHLAVGVTRGAPAWASQPESLPPVLP
ncbi:hypothetical protein VTI28DRAFT_5578 [Corynascus sepedonium]